MSRNWTAILPLDSHLEATRHLSISRKEHLRPNHLDFSTDFSEIGNHRPLMFGSQETGAERWFVALHPWLNW